MKIQNNDNNFKKTMMNDNHLKDKNENNKNSENENLEKSKTVTITKKRKKIIEKYSINSNKNSELIKDKINVNSNNSEYSQSNNNKIVDLEMINSQKDKSSNSDIPFSIITLDIDGNVNLYKCGKEVTLFNLYNLKGISQKIKQDKFFSMGYEYYIKSNLEYFCISTDQGCFVVKKKC